MSGPCDISKAFYTARSAVRRPTAHASERVEELPRATLLTQFSASLTILIWRGQAVLAFTPSEGKMLAYVFVAFAVLFRFLPHGPFVTLCQSCGLWNLTPVGASLLYFGARQPQRRMWLPVAALVASDIALNLFVYHMALDPSYLITWAWYAAAILIGSVLAPRVSVLRLAGASLALSMSFFVMSNFAVWTAGYLYPRTMAGLVTCYTMAIPFFKNTLAGDLLFSAAFFGVPV